ncbi:MAG TPA: hypothetical protein VLU46_09590 [Thermoanaerobaculia bacterium]|nr:hypothetical protein [Thermoanaerobaculia bacterium]
MRPKHSAPVDGSLTLTKSNSTGFGLDLGGTLVKDRVWFFASAERGGQAPSPVRTGEAPVLQMFDAKANANIGDRQNLAVTFNQSKTQLTVPTSFLSLHYTGVLTPNAFFTFNVSQSAAGRP